MHSNLHMHAAVTFTPGTTAMAHQISTQDRQSDGFSIQGIPEIFGHDGVGFLPVYDAMTQEGMSQRTMSCRHPLASLSGVVPRNSCIFSFHTRGTSATCRLPSNSAFSISNLQSPDFKLLKAAVVYWDHILGQRLPLPRCKNGV